MDFKALAFDTERPTHVNIVECAGCHFAWQHPWGRTVEESVDWFSDAYGHGTATESSYFSLDSKRKIADLEMGFVKKLPVTSRRLLDIGAGAGVFAKTAAANGWSVTAVDPSLDLHYLSSAQLVTAIKGTLENLPAHESFEVVTLWDVIEHASTPVSLITSSKERVASDGWLVLETGNYKSVERVKEGLNHWIYQLDHRWYFSPDSLRTLLE